MFERLLFSRNTSEVIFKTSNVREFIVSLRKKKKSNTKNQTNEPLLCFLINLRAKGMKAECFFLLQFLSVGLSGPLLPRLVT